MIAVAALLFFSLQTQAPGWMWHHVAPVAQTPVGPAANPPPHVIPQTLHFLARRPPSHIYRQPAAAPDATPNSAAKPIRRFAYPYWSVFGQGNSHRLPESFVLRNRIRAALLENPDEKSLELAHRALELAPESTDARFLEAWMRARLQTQPVTPSLQMQDRRLPFLRFFDAYRHGDLDQALALLNTLPLNIQERFFLFLHLGNRLIQAGILADAYKLLRRALELLENQHLQFFGMRGTVKRDLYRFIVTCLAEIRFKSGDYRLAFGFLQWVGQNDHLAAQDPLSCRWDELLDRRCPTPDPLVPQPEKLSLYAEDDERLDFHRALWAWGRDWRAGAAAMGVFLEKHPQSVWTITVQEFRNWVQSAPHP